MKNIEKLQNVVVDREKVAALIKNSTANEVKQLIGVQDSQISNLRHGTRGPSANGLLRLMMYYGLQPKDLAKIEGS